MALGVAVVPAGAQAGQKTAFGMVGVVAGQSLRVSAVQIGDPGVIGPPDPISVCQVELGFVDAAGASRTRKAAGLGRIIPP
mgnify:CR=1 FL=1